MLIWQCDTVWHSTDTNTATTFSKISVRLCGVWSVVLMMMICAGEMWQQCGRFVHIRYSRHASPPLPLYSLIATSIKLGNQNAGGGEFSVTKHQHTVDIPDTGCTLYCMKSIFYCFPVISRKLMLTTGCALTSHWSNDKEASPCLTRYYIT